MNNLEACLGISPFCDRNIREICSLAKAPSNALSPSQPTCVVFTLEDGGGSLSKLLRIFSTFAKILFLNILLSRKNLFITKSYGIYPSTKQPLVIFEMQSRAEGYVVDKILPENPSGLNGYLRLIVARLTKINPVLGGIAIVIREKD